MFGVHCAGAEVKPRDAQELPSSRSLASTVELKLGFLLESLRRDYIP